MLAAIVSTYASADVTDLVFAGILVYQIVSEAI